MVDRLRGGLAALIAAALVAMPAAAASDGPANGARPMGMGGAFVAISDDANAPLYNPAGLGAAEGARIALTRAAYFSGVADPLVSQDVAHIIIGSGGNGFAAGITSLADGDAVYRETVASVGYGRGFGSSLRVGALVKRIGVGLDDANPDVSDNPYFADGTSVSAITTDVGVLVSPATGLAVGASAQNLVPADLTFRQDESAESDDATTTVRIGAAYRLASVAGSAEQAALADVLRRSIVAADIATGGGTTGVALGVELGLSDTLAARVGYRTASGYGESVGALTVGGSVGVAMGGGTMHVDFAADIAGGDLRDNLTQRVSLRGAF
jgi:hypothetical protein